ncbi:MAG TPA: O-antigen ligase family protein, partial [Planctomycetota bacterium]|nr:O-antigen ligase family protein [Planctomycetota bacterium]
MPSDTPARGRAARRVATAAAAVVPLVWLPGFFEGFVAPRLVWAAAVFAPLAALAAARTPGAFARARAPLAWLGVALVGGLAPLPFAEGGAPWADALARTPLIAASVGWLLYGAAMGASSADRARLRGGFAVATLAALAVGLLRRHAGAFAALPDRADVGLASTLGNSNALAEFAAPAALAAAAGLLAAPGRAARVLAACGAAAGVVAVLASQSRAGVLALLVGAAVAAPVFVRAASRRARAVALGAVALLAVAFFVAPQAEPWRARAATVFDPDHATNAVRLDAWTGAVRLLRDAPAGVGLGRFEAEFPPYREPREWLLSGVDTRVDHPHSEPLFAATEGGPLALAALVAWWILAAGRARRATRAGDVAHGAALAAALAAFLVF